MPAGGRIIQGQWGASRSGRPARFRTLAPLENDGPQPSVEAVQAARRKLYRSLVGGAVGGRYQLERLIDFGAMGAVFEARHRADAEAAYAVKVLDPELASRDRRFVRRFVREARILKEAEHPNIVKVFEHGRYEPPDVDAALYYYVMELVRGDDGGPVTLHAYAARHELRLQDVVFLVAQILSGLRHVHSMGIVHRDLKPWNVLVGAEGRCKIVDFGLAKIPDSDLTDVDELFGTRDYIAPELFYRGAREATASADIFAVGRIFADLVDRVDFKRNRAGVFASKASAMRYLEELLTKLREEDPTLRFQSAQDVMKVLDEFEESTRIRTTAGHGVRRERERLSATSARRGFLLTLARGVGDYGLFVVGVAILPFVWMRAPPVAALVAGSLVASKVWSALSHPPDRHPIAIVVRALSARLNRVRKDGDFHVQYYTRGGFLGGGPLRPRHVSHGHRRHYRSLRFPDGVGVVGYAAVSRTAVVLHSVPRWGSEPFRELMERHLRVPESLWRLHDSTRRGFFAVPVFRILRQDRLRVVGVLAIDTRLADGMLASDVNTAIKEYAAVIQDVIEPVHGLSVREIIVGGAAPLETILVNGKEPRVPPIHDRRILG